MRALGIGRWLLLPWEQDEAVPTGKLELSFAEPGEAAQLLRTIAAEYGATPLRAFVHELELGPALARSDGELLEFLARALARRRVRLFDLVELPMASDDPQLLERIAPTEQEQNIIEELELIDWEVELDAEELVFEVGAEPEELPELSLELTHDELPPLTTELEGDEAPPLSTELTTQSQT